MYAYDHCLFVRLAFAGSFGLMAGVLLTGCTTRYVTPARSVSMSSLLDADADVAERLAREPAAEFPVRIATARIQESGYRSHRARGYGEGRYSVVTVRDVETDADFDWLEALPLVAKVARLNRLVIPATLQSDRELRLAAASLKADMVLVYSFDTTFRVDGKDVGPLGVITLGVLPLKEAIVTSTASAALFDVRTGYVYALAEFSAREKQSATAWGSSDAVDDARVRAERDAFVGLLNEVGRSWVAVIAEYAPRRVPQTAAKEPA